MCPEDNYTARIEELLSKMSLREKVGQFFIIEPCFVLEALNDAENGESYSGISDPEFLKKILVDYKVGFFLFGGVSRVGDGSPQAWAEYISQVNAWAMAEQINIPLMLGIDAVHGLNFMKGSTIYPHNLAITATWNPELAKRYTSLVGAELVSIGFNCNFAPTIDVARDPRWGRVYESLGEDPYLASMISKSLVEGLQENGDLAACAKHFIGYGESNNGTDRTPADLSHRAIMETHLPPFRAAIESDVLSIMVSGGDVNGVPVPASKRLLTGLLRQKLGFTGITISDWEDVVNLHTRHKISADKKECIARAFNAGLDVNMAVADLNAVDLMLELVAEGRISIERVDEATRNVLRVKFKLGLFANKRLDAKKAAALVGNKKSRKVAETLALQSMTLMKNENNILPLAKDIKSILVTGMAADSKRHLCGGWTLGWAGAQEEDLDCKTLLDAIKQKVSANTLITYVKNSQDLENLNLTQKTFDVCISVVSEEPHAEWVGDSIDMQLEADEETILKSSFNTGIPVVMVSLLGRPQNITWAAENIPAILWAYLPGTEGAKPIAEVLFGDVNPSGRLPVTFPKDASQIPLVYNARRYESDAISTSYEPLYPFGHGLSYTEFAYYDLQAPDSIESGESARVAIIIKNVGPVDGCDVVQLYLKDMYASVTRPLKSLKAFDRIFLKAGEEKEVSFILGSCELSILDENLEPVVEPREIEIQIGNLSKKVQIV